MEVLRVENISLTRSKPILKDISFEVMQGEMVILLGPSGSGKTSLLRCLNRLETIDSGQVFLKGKEIALISAKELRRRTGMVFQTIALIPGTVSENVSKGPRLHNKKINNEEIRELLGQVGLPWELWDQDVETLSLGERQRIALAQVLANQPEILLLDEPTSALDPAAVLKIERLVQEIHQKCHTTVILVTHNLDQARRLNGRTLFINRGELVACGNLNEVMQRSNSPELKSYFNLKEEL